MTNIHDYLLWRGDIVLKNNKDFNEVDSLSLARLSYLPFNKVKIKSKDTIGNLTSQMIDFKDEDFLYKGDKEFATYLSKSERFKNLIVTDYINVDDKKVEKQFGAITIHLPFKEIYVSFLGTDKTINGWKEDFNMAFMDNVPCQISGLDYIKDISSKYPLKKIRVGGHSKGGNIAIYASLLSPENIQKKIIKVDNFDGPGLSKNVISKYKDSKFFNKITSYIPQESIIGRLLEHEEKMIICESKERGIYQHDIYSWSVLGPKFIKLSKITKTSEVFNEMVTDWLKNTTIEERKIFVDCLFDLFEESGVNSFAEIAKSLTISIPKMLKKYNSLSDDKKKNMTNMIKKFYTSYANVSKKRKKK